MLSRAAPRLSSGIGKMAQKGTQRKVGGMEIEEFRKQAHQVVDFICDYYKGLDERPIQADVKPGFLAPQIPKEAPEEPEDFATVMEDYKRIVMPGTSHWQHPGNCAWFPANYSFPGQLADFLGGMTNCIGFTWKANPVATEMETVMMDWMAKATGLPEKFLHGRNSGGCIQGTASEASLLGLLAGRSRALSTKWDQSKETEGQFMDRLVCYSTSQAHSSIQKAAMIAGIPARNQRFIETKAENNHGLTAGELREAIEADVAKGLVPFTVFVTVGTTSTCAFDDTEGLATVAQEFGAWVHVDAAYAGAAMICPEYSHLGKGLEKVDSFCFNAHKWLLCNFDCSLLWTSDLATWTKALTLTPTYLESEESTSGLAWDYKDWQVPLGRRFRSLKMWFVMRMYGIKGLQEHIRKGCDHAKWVAEAMKADGRFEFVGGALSLVCYRLKDQPDEVQEELLKAINETNRAWIVHTVVDGKIYHRISFGGALQEQEDAESVWKIVKDCSDKVLAQK